MHACSHARTKQRTHPEQASEALASHLQSLQVTRECFQLVTDSARFLQRSSQARKHNSTTKPQLLLLLLARQVEPSSTQLVPTKSFALRANPTCNVVAEDAASSKMLPAPSLPRRRPARYLGGLVTIVCAVFELLWANRASAALSNTVTGLCVRSFSPPRPAVAIRATAACLAACRLATAAGAAAGTSLCAFGFGARQPPTATGMPAATHRHWHACP